MGTLTSLSWLPRDQQDQLRAGLGDPWIPKLRAFLDQKYPDWARATQAQVATFVTQWLPTILKTVPAAPGKSPNQVARQALDELSVKVSQDRKDLAGQASAEELQQIFAELLQEGMAARAR